MKLSEKLAYRAPWPSSPHARGQQSRVPLAGVPQIPDEAVDEITIYGDVSAETRKRCEDAIAAACQEIRRRHVALKRDEA